MDRDPNKNPGWICRGLAVVGPESQIRRLLLYCFLYTGFGRTALLRTGFFGFTLWGCFFLPLAYAIFLPVFVSFGNSFLELTLVGFLHCSHFGPEGFQCATGLFGRGLLCRGFF